MRINQYAVALLVLAACAVWRGISTDFAIFITGALIILALTEERREQ